MKTTLNGLRILNTRPVTAGLILHEAIQALGGVSIIFPALAIEPTPCDWIRQLPDLEHIQQMIFISTNAVNYFFKHLKKHHLLAIFKTKNIQITTIGRSTALALLEWGLKAHHYPSIADSEHLLKLDNFQRIQHQNILLIKGEQGRETITNTLRRRGANLLIFDVYRRVLPQINREYIDSLWQDDTVDIILLTSEQTLHNLFDLFGQSALPWLCSKPWLVISQRLADIALSFGINTIIISPYDDLMNTLKGLANDNSCRKT